MGCSSSKDTGRENFQELGAGFFPPDEQNQKSLKPATPVAPPPFPSSTTDYSKSANQKVVVAVATTTPIEEPTQESPAQRRKSSYVPPAPIFPPPSNNTTTSTPSTFVPPLSPNEASASSLADELLGPQTAAPGNSDAIDFGAFQKAFGGSVPLSPGSSLGSESHQPTGHSSQNKSSSNNIPSTSVAYQAAGQPRRSSKIGEPQPHQPPPLHAIVAEDESHKTGGGRSSYPSDTSSGIRSNNSKSVPPIPGIILEQEQTSAQDDRKQSTASNSSSKKKKHHKSATSADHPSEKSPKSPAKQSSSSTTEKVRMPHHQQKPHQFYDYPKDSPEPSSSSGMRFDELYRLKGVLGTGAFSTVREGYHRSNPSLSYAVKCVNRKKLSEEDEAALLDEVSILKELRHVHIIRLYDFFNEPNTYYLVMERMRGGELFDRIVAKAYYNEKEARDTCKILLEAVGYCHDNYVAHRDLKPENLLLLSEHDDSAVKIADFGFAKKVSEPNSLTTQCGTPGYVAPEILEGIPYDQRADMWSVGVILYILLGGYPPFIENNQRDLFRKIRRGEYEFHEEYWGTVSHEAKGLISSLLQVDPGMRLTADQALHNSWIRGDDADLERRDLGVNLQEFRRFNAKRKFKAAVSTIMAVNKLQSLGKDFLSTLKQPNAVVSPSQQEHAA